MNESTASAQTAPRTGKRRLAPIAALATASLVAAGVAYAGNLNTTGAANALDADYSAEQSEALAAILSGDLAGIDLADIVYAQSAYSAAPGPNQGTLEVELLNQALDVDLGTLNIPLLELLSLGDLGAAFTQGTSSDATSSRAETSTIGQNGVVDLDAVLGSTTNAAELDLTELFASIGVDGLTDAILDEASLTLGALASIAEVTDGGVIETGDDAVPGEYVIAGSHIQLHSPLVGQLLTTIDDTLGGLGTTLDEVVGSQGVVDGIAGGLGTLDLPLLEVDTTGTTVSVDGVDAALAGIVDSLIPAEGLGADAVKVFPDGSIDIDLAQLHEGGLNNLPANTPLLSDTVLAGVTDELTDILDSIVDGLLETVTAALSSATVNVQVDLAVTLATDEGLVTDAVSDILSGKTVSEVLDLLSVLGLGAVADLVNGLLDVLSLGGLIPLDELLGSTVGSLAGVLDLVLSPIVDTLVGSDVATVSADVVVPFGGLLAGTPAAVVDTEVTLLGDNPLLGELLGDVTSTLTGAVDPLLESTVNTTLATIVPTLTSTLASLLDDVDGGPLDLALDPILSQLLGAVDGLVDGLSGVLAITLNHQPTPYLPGENDFTVNAVNVNVLSGVVDLSLASSSVRALTEAVVEYETSISADPGSVEPGETVTITGDGFEPLETVVINIDGVDVGTTTADEDGVLVPFEYDVPGDAAAETGVVVIATGEVSDTPATDTFDITEASAADADVNASASASASANADDESNASAQVAAQAAALADASTDASAAADATAASAAEAAATADASSDASTTADTDTTAAAQAAAQSSAEADSQADATSAANANASAAAAAASNADSSTDASAEAAANEDADADVNASASASASANADDESNASAQVAAQAAALADASTDAS
ncbi:choice-of-anchor G family protein, partial [Microbacterium gilvum]|uniref:choice-of-anchor G family protein n=1 Tax=Microbacterium gilvum TaxID=1336204 RepID=UPI0031E769FD